MSEVRLTVGERTYTVACADGQEQRIEFLGGRVDAKLKAMGGNLTSNEAKNLLFAALMLADELDEAGTNSPAPPTAQIPRPGVLRWTGARRSLAGWRRRRAREGPTPRGS